MSRKKLSESVYNRRLTEGLMEKVFGFLMKGKIKQVEKMFDDPKLSRAAKDVDVARKKFMKSYELYKKKHGK